MRIFTATAGALFIAALVAIACMAWKQQEAIKAYEADRAFAREVSAAIDADIKQLEADVERRRMENLSPAELTRETNNFIRSMREQNNRFSPQTEPTNLKE